MLKSQVYEVFIDEFLKYQSSAARRCRLDAINSKEHENFNIVEQSSVESTAEITLKVLARLGIIEDDVDITWVYRKDSFLESINKQIENE